MRTGIPRFKDLFPKINIQAGPTVYHISAEVRGPSYDPTESRLALRRACDQWDEIVTANNGEVQERAKVAIDGTAHYHDNFILDEPNSLHRHCDLCRAARNKEREVHGFRGHLANPPRVTYELEVVRRTVPRKLVPVPLPVPIPRTNNARIRKKWAKQAAGKTGFAYATETIKVRTSKSTLVRMGKEFALREKYT